MVTAFMFGLAVGLFIGVWSMVVRIDRQDICPHGFLSSECVECMYDGWDEAMRDQTCPHGNQAGDCDACDVESDFAYDCWRETK